MEGGCQVPAGVHVQIEKNIIKVNALISNFDMNKMIRIKKYDHIDNRKKLLDRCIQELDEKGVQDIIKDNRNNLNLN